MLIQLRNSVTEAFKVYITLLWIMIPTVILVKLLQEAGVVEVISQTAAPLMALLGLPEAMSIVWATTLFTNIYTGVIIFFSLTANEPLSIAQVSVLGTLMVICHSIPIEGAIARKAGVPWWLTVVLRVVGAFVLGWLLNLIYSTSGYLQETSVLLWQPGQIDTSFTGWIISQLQALISIFFVILFLIILLQVIRVIGIEKLLHFILVPFLALIGIKKCRQYCRYRSHSGPDIWRGNPTSRY